MKRLVLATRNENKKKEIKRLLKDVKAKVLSLNEVNAHIPAIVEDGKTFRQNAVKKAVTISRLIDELVVADDSGLEVDCLQGRPGVRSSRFAHTKASDSENNAKLLRLMEGIPLEDRTATFVCHVAVAYKGSLVGTVEGKCRGRIGLAPKGSNGFGYDPLFVPDGYKKTFAQFKRAFKNGISHRGIAMVKAEEIIKKYL